MSISSTSRELAIAVTEEIDKLEKVTLSGQKRDLNISEGEGKDYFGYVFEGVMKIEQSGM